MQNLCRKCYTVEGAEWLGKNLAIYLDLFWKPHHQYDNAHKWLSIGGVYLPGTLIVSERLAVSKIFVKEMGLSPFKRE